MRLQGSILGVLVATISSFSFAQAPCSARTPQQALPSGSVAAAHQAAPVPGANFYRLARIVVDPELHRSWALVANCTHPERPMETGCALDRTCAARGCDRRSSACNVLDSRGDRTNRASASRACGQFVIVSNRSHASRRQLRRRKPKSDPSATATLIRAGDLVRLWSSDGNVRLEMAVVSLEYGRAGQIIHVRRLGQTALLAGVVVGKDSAELIP